MNIVTLWCIPPLSDDDEENQKRLEVLQSEILEAFSSNALLAFKKSTDALVLFPANLMHAGIGSEIYVELKLSPVKVIKEHRRGLVQKIITTIYSHIEHTTTVRVDVTNSLTTYSYAHHVPERAVSRP